jgi:hypothetical protein
MTKPDRLKQQQARRMLELFAIARKRYLDAGGDPRRTPSGRKGDDYMTEQERQEALELGRQVFDYGYINSYLETKRQNRQTANQSE